PPGSNERPPGGGWRPANRASISVGADRLTHLEREHTMYNATEQFAELNKANVAQATKLAALAIENTEKLMRLNLSAAKTALAQGVEGAQAAAAIKDVQDLVTLRTKYA